MLHRNNFGRDGSWLCLYLLLTHFELFLKSYDIFNIFQFAVDVYDLLRAYEKAPAVGVGIYFEKLTVELETIGLVANYDPAVLLPYKLIF